MRGPILPSEYAILLDQRLADALDDLEDIHALLTWQQVTWESEHLEPTPLSAAQEQGLKRAIMTEQAAMSAIQELWTMFSEERIWGNPSGVQEGLHAEALCSAFSPQLSGETHPQQEKSRVQKDEGASNA